MTASGSGADLRDIQGNILRGYRLPVAAFLFLGIADAAGGRRWLGAMADLVTNAERWDRKPASTLNLALTASGLRALGVTQECLDTFSPEFLQGMAARAELLGDTGSGSPSTWDVGPGSPAVHLMAEIHAASSDQLARAAGELTTSLSGTGITLIARQDAARLPGDREHFGFRDGFGQPWIDGPDSGRVFNGQGTPDGREGWKPVALGEFLLGHPDEEGVASDGPVPGVLARNGTYLVYRKLRQDVPLFRRLIRAQAHRLGGDEALVAAKIVGRWPDGSPLVLSPEHPDPELGGDMSANNDFRYGDDDRGLRCPVGAHIRRANPRDALGFSAQMVSRHRMIRRGISYGAPLAADGDSSDDGDRGLVFMAAMSSLSRQFEFVQSQWLNDGNIFHLGADKDVIAGNQDGSGKMTVQGSPPAFFHPVPLLTTTRGGDYFFRPGIGALNWLATGDLGSG